MSAPIVSVTVVLVGPPITAERAAALVHAIAPLVIGRALELREIERVTFPDLDHGPPCWSARWRDGDVELDASVTNGEGNPRDGYGYTPRAQLTAPWRDKPRWWRAELSGGAQDRRFASPIRVRVLDVTREAFDAIRARALEVLPEHRDVTREDPYASKELRDAFEST